MGTQILKNTCEVCEVSVGCSEWSVSEISQSGCVGGLGVGTVWVSVWRLLVKGSPLLAVLSLSAREGHRDVPPSGFSLFCWFPSVSRFLTGVFRVSAPHPQHSPLDASERIRQHPGSESLLCAPLSPELWRPLCALGPSHSLRPCLSPHCCAHPERWGPEARPGSL